jgi:hypothetical protein
MDLAYIRSSIKVLGLKIVSEVCLSRSIYLRGHVHIHVATNNVESTL